MVGDTEIEPVTPTMSTSRPQPALAVYGGSTRECSGEQPRTSGEQGGSVRQVSAKSFAAMKRKPGDAAQTSSRTSPSLDFDPIVATMSSVGRPKGTKAPGTIRCEYHGVFVEHRSPEHKLARKLITAGYDPKSPYSTKWDRGPRSLRWKSLQDAADWEVYEIDHPKEGQPGLVKKRWRPMPADRMAALCVRSGRTAPEDTDLVINTAGDVSAVSDSTVNADGVE
jgi:hypothetical protein